jgi:hypothetical protein
MPFRAQQLQFMQQQLLNWLASLGPIWESATLLGHQQKQKMLSWQEGFG